MENFTPFSRLGSFSGFSPDPPFFSAPQRTMCGDYTVLVFLDFWDVCVLEELALFFWILLFGHFMREKPIFEKPLRFYFSSSSRQEIPFTLICILIHRAPICRRSPHDSV